MTVFEIENNLDREAEVGEAIRHGEREYEFSTFVVPRTEEEAQELAEWLRGLE